MNLFEQIDFKNNSSPYLSGPILNKMQQNINEGLQKYLEKTIPIGQTYITQNDENPAEILGFGTWELIKKMYRWRISCFWLCTKWQF